MRIRVTRPFTAMAFLTVALAGLSAPALAGTYNVTFSPTQGGPAPTGTVTFADPEPAGTTNVPAIAFEFTDGTSTWTLADDTVGFNLGGFSGGSLQFLAIKVYDAPTGRAIELLSSIPGDFVVCDPGDPTLFCSSVANPGDTAGNYSFAVQQVPGVTFWGAAILLGLMLLALARRVMGTGPGTEAA